ncbi:AAA family ATPase [Halomonas halocynthiae]|uniref:AAA family ATPase n=1 Tax=Halomonas halocynthiae TaxID=176290 RepID=UPI00041F34C0|nr:AAA family ATPase [Halomonas halocynthiae]
MRLTHVRVENFQQFRTPLEINDLDDGINLFVGPNESGKSTLVRAIRAAFFERYKTRTLVDLQPWGDSSAAPEVSLAFEWQGKHWTLNKRFLQRQRSDLTSGGEHYSGDEADDRLAELLGYDIPGRGASKAEHWGIPGLLWVEQGAVQEMREPVGHAGGHLQSALSQSLGDALGDIASSSGDALIASVERERGELLTATGRPTGELRDVQQQCDAHASELTKLDGQVEQYHERVDRLGELQRLQKDIDAARPWEEQQEKARLGQQQLDEVHKLQALQAQQRHQLETCQRNLQIYRQQLQGFDNEAQQLEKRLKAREQARLELSQYEAATSGVEQRISGARAAYEAAKAQYQMARSQARRQSLEQDSQRLITEIDQLSRNLDSARELSESQRLLAEQRQRCRVDEKQLIRLQKLEQALGELGIRREALATRLRYSLEADQQLMLDEEPLSGTGEQLLVAPGEIRIPRVGTLIIKPGGSDVSELVRQQQRLADERDDLLKRLGISDLASAQAQARRAEQLKQQAQQQQARLEGLAPSGVEALEAQQQLAIGRRDTLDAELAALPVASENGSVPNESQAQATLDNVEQQLKAAEQAATDHAGKLGLARQALRTADAEWQRQYDDINAPDRQQRKSQVTDALLELKAEAEQLEAALKKRQHEIEAANPEVLEQDVKRFTRAADSLRQQASARAAEINDLQARLETLGAQGLEEKREEIRLVYQRQQRRQAELEQRSEALDLLLELLKSERQAVTRRLQAPLQKHLNRYLRLLFPGAELSVDDDLRPSTLIRQGASQPQRDDLEALSFGAREQMGLVTRLAYADLLQDAGRPTLIILDDALVHCDQARREQMKRILFDAAQRHQILLFTCHPENWQDLGAVPRDMLSLRRDCD